MKSKRRHRVAPRGEGQSAGTVPGTILFIGEQKVGTPRIEVIDYSPSALTEERNATVEQCCRLAQAGSVTWINVNGVHDAAMLEKFGKLLGLHPLTLEDIGNTTHRPKAEDFPDYTFMVMKMISYNDAERHIETEHISLILGKGFVLSFLEDEGDVFDGVRDRLRTAKGRIRNMGADYLFYCLMDAVVDNYFLAVEKIGDHIEELDDSVMSDLAHDPGHELHMLKRDVLRLRKSVWPLREELAEVERGQCALLGSEVRLFLRDLQDHTLAIIDIVESYRDVLSSIHDTYLTSMSNRMNEVMKVLTIIATVFIPLTFVAGVYGMNFKNMPELEWPWGYPAALLAMLAMGAGMVYYFRRKKWL